MEGAPRTGHAGAPFRLLHAFPSFAVGGAQRRFAILANALGHAYAHHVVTLDGEDAARRLLNSDVALTVEHMAPRKSSLVSPGNLRRFARILKAQAPDLLLTYNWGAIEWALANRLAGGRPHIHFEDGFGPEETADRQLRRRIWTRRLALAKTAAIVVPSRALERLATRRWGFAPEKVRFIANGIDPTAFAKPPADAMSFRIRPDDIIVGALGALRAEKNLHRLIAAVDRVRKAIPVRLAIIGDGPARKALEADIARRNMTDTVFFAGHVDAPARALAGLDVFALSSDTEQAPFSLMEAMASGLPVVATDVGDVMDIVPEASRAFITPAGDDEAFAGALEKLCRDRPLREMLGEANRAHARAHFDRSRMIRAYDRLFRTVTGAGRASP